MEFELHSRRQSQLVDVHNITNDVTALDNAEDIVTQQADVHVQTLAE